MRAYVIIGLFTILFYSSFGHKFDLSAVNKCEQVEGQLHEYRNQKKSGLFAAGKSGGFAKTQGAVWPKPQSQKSTEDFLAVLPSRFSFKVTDKTCDILESAFQRYYILTFDPPRLNRRWKAARQSAVEKLLRDKKYAGFLDSLEVTLHNDCSKDWPTSDMDEQYELKINTADQPGKASLFSQTVWGILRGLETFSQLVYHTPDGLFLINSTLILDFPRFSFRGVMLDTSRHFIPKRVILDNLDTMAQNKFNVFHWHIVDENSFPYQSKSFPSMHKEGAYDEYTHVYTSNDITDIIYFARLRGIRVIPEFDTPGHTLAWGLGIPGLLTTCYKNVNGTLVPNGFGPIDPTKESTYNFLKVFLNDVSKSFADTFIHLGGDEVSFDCWRSNPDVQKFMKKMGYGDNYAKLEEYYMTRLLEIVSSQGNRSYIVWQEVFDNGVKIKPETIVDVWKSPYEKEMDSVTKGGYRTLLSACWYLDYISYGSDWKTYYQCDPHSFNGTATQKKLVMGGEACLWSEFVDATNLTPRLWPRASSTAERLWSDQSVKNTAEAAPRLEEHRCRMLIRGVNAEPPNGPSFCPVDFRVE